MRRANRALNMYQALNTPATDGSNLEAGLPVFRDPGDPSSMAPNAQHQMQSKSSLNATDRAQTIRILSDRVANQIAAGEVIERPVAVVKELVENSLDAGAGRIEVEFRNGGKSYIRVADDGHGMTEDNALLALERHATSKIRKAADLNAIRTLGFRGEALPSIASVSRFTLRTRAAAHPHGTELLVNGGRLIHRKEFGMPPGSWVEVAHLFNAVPARRKFLKTENTEAAHIIHLVKLLAIAHPQTAFRLMENSRVIFQSPQCLTLLERVREIFGRQISANLLSIEESGEGISLTGLIGKPGVGRATRQEMVVFVNGRPVDSRTLNYALIEGYHTYIPKGRYPLAFLFCDVDPREVDVNVHPAKREVRFRNEGHVRRHVIEALLRCLRDAAGFGSPLDIQVDSPEQSSERFPAMTPVMSKPGAPVSRVEGIGSADQGGASRTFGQERPLPTGPVQPATATDRREAGGTPESSPDSKSRRLNWRFLNLVQGPCALFETESGLVLMHCRTARERVLFDALYASMSNEVTRSQRLIFPVPLELDAISTSVLEENRTFLQKRGFEIEPFGRNFYRISEVPDWLEPSEIEGFLRDLVALVRERGPRPESEDVAIEVLARLAASRAARDEASSATEMILLAESLMVCANPLTDPKGRPTLIELSWSELRTRFQR